MGRVVSINVSTSKGTSKKPVEWIRLIEGVGVEGDAHSHTQREVSLLSLEDIESFGKSPGDFAENITFAEIDTSQIRVGTILKIGEALLEVTAIGKRCHLKCEIYREMGDCIMPRKGFFAKVLRGGIIKPGDIIEVI